MVNLNNNGNKMALSLIGSLQTDDKKDCDTEEGTKGTKRTVDSTEDGSSADDRPAEKKHKGED